MDRTYRLPTSKPISQMEDLSNLYDQQFDKAIFLFAKNKLSSRFLKFYFENGSRLPPFRSWFCGKDHPLDENKQNLSLPRIKIERDPFVVSCCIRNSVSSPFRREFLGGSDMSGRIKALRAGKGGEIRDLTVQRCGDSRSVGNWSGGCAARCNLGEVTITLQSVFILFNFILSFFFWMVSEEINKEY